MLHSFHAIGLGRARFQVFRQMLSCMKLRLTFRAWLDVQEIDPIVSSGESILKFLTI